MKTHITMCLFYAIPWKPRKSKCELMSAGLLKMQKRFLQQKDFDKKYKLSVKETLFYLTIRSQIWKLLTYKRKWSTSFKFKRSSKSPELLNSNKCKQYYSERQTVVPFKYIFIKKHDYHLQIYYFINKLFSLTR